ncbi:MAG: hypothetical protein DMG76_28030, partial [Acidobacteria bacterium]
VSFRAHHLFASFVRRIERAAGVPTFWFRADEIGHRGGRFHIHALIGNVAHLRRMTFIDRWNELAGYARILPFDSKRGAAYYCAKYVAKEINEWELSDNLHAFANYQPVLALEGGSKARKPILEPKNREKETRVRPNQRQFPMPYALEGITSPQEDSILSVYKSEVTRGRAKFRNFGFDE